MPNPNNAVSTELDAVNQILSSVGQAPVTTLDMQNPETYTVLQTLRDVNRQIQSEGWTFNTEYRVKFEPDSDNKISIPYNVLQMDANPYKHNNKYHMVRKDGKLYDIFWHRRLNAKEFEFTEDIYCDVVYFYRFNDIPFAFQAHIIARSARLAAIKLVGNAELIQLLAIEEDKTREALMEYETQQGDYSFFGGTNYTSSYQPFQALNRR